MPNPIKYSLTSQSLALKTGNYYIGTGDVGKGPTSSTGYYNGITPPSGGYTIYLNKESGGPSIFTPTNDSELILITNKIAGTNYTTVIQCLNYFAGQNDKMCFNRDYEPIVTNGLVLNLDAGFVPSYPQSGTTWYDISLSGNNGTLINGPTYNSANGGSIVFDSANDMAIIPYDNDFNLCSIVNWTISIWINLTDIIGSFNCLIGQWPQDGDDAWLLAHTNGTVGFVWAPFSVYNYMFQSNTPLVVGNWTNVVLVKNGSNFTLYQNTVSVGTFTNASTKSSSYRVELGRYGRSYSYIGAQYSTVTINHRALSAAEVLQNYNATKSRFGL